MEDLAFPTEVEGIKHKIVKIYAGLDYSMALTGTPPCISPLSSRSYCTIADGDYYAWGLGEMWQLGNIERDVKSRPIFVQHSQKFVELATAGVSVLGLTGSSPSPLFPLLALFHMIKLLSTEPNGFLFFSSLIHSN